MNEELETALSEIKRQLMFNDWTNPEFDFQDLITNLNLLSGDTEDESKLLERIKQALWKIKSQDDQIQIIKDIEELIGEEIPEARKNLDKIKEIMAKHKK